MGRAIDMENRLDQVITRVNRLENLLDELAKPAPKKEKKGNCKWN